MSDRQTIRAPLRLHVSTTRELVAAHNEGFVDGLCDAIDALRELGRPQVADELLDYLFRPAADKREAAE